MSKKKPNKKKSRKIKTTYKVWDFEQMRTLQDLKKKLMRNGNYVSQKNKGTDKIIIKNQKPKEDEQID